MNVVVYLSGHGFGHASREVEVMNALGTRHGAAIHIRSAVDRDLLERTMRVPFELTPGEYDTGIVQSSSVAHDDDATVAEARRFYATFDARVERECEALAGAPVDAIVGDIPPLAFATARRLGVPGIAIANFTWDWIYETHPGFLPAGAHVLETIRSAYRSATDALALPFSSGLDIFPHVMPLPLVARRPTQSRAATRAHFGLPADSPVALLSFGGYGLPALDLNRLDCRDRWTIAMTTRTHTGTAAPSGVVCIDEQRFRGSAFRYEDLVAAADIVVTKPGYGIIAECIAAGTAMLYTSRGAFREYDLLVRELPRYVRARFIEQDDLFAGRWSAHLDALAAAPDPPERLETNGAEVAADFIAARAAR